MKISFIYPPTGCNSGGKNYQWWIYRELTKTHEVLDNDCSGDCDVIICMTVTQISILKDIRAQYPNIPLIFYHHDWFPFLDPNPEYFKQLKECKEIWVNSEDTRELTKKDIKLDSVVIYPPIITEEWEDIEVRDDNYAIMASRRDGYKRFDWFERACNELRIASKSFHPAVHARRDYLNAMAQSSVCVSTSLYEGFGLTPAEAAYLGKTLVLTDIPIFRELWDGRAYFFKADDYNDFKRILKKAFKERGFRDNKKYVEDNFTPSKMAQKINDRLANYSMDRRSI